MKYSVFILTGVWLVLAAVWASGQGEGSAGEGTEALPAGVAIPLVVEDGEATAGEARWRLRTEWLRQGMLGARRDGLYGLADRYAAELAEEARDTELIREALEMRLQVALLEGRTEAVASLVEALREGEREVDPLLAGFAAYFEGDLEAARAAAGGGRTEAENRERRAWFLFLEALVAVRAGESAEANRLFLRAERQAPNSLLRNHFELLRMREELRRGELTAEGRAALRETMRSLRGERAGFEAARLLGTALYRAGEAGEAVALLSQHLDYPGLREYGLREQFLLLLGMFAGPETTRGRMALRELVGAGTDAGLRDLALTLLARHLDGEWTASFLENLGEWLAERPPHPLSARMLAYRGTLLFERGEREAATAAAERLLEEFGDSQYAGNALRILAQGAYESQPPRYRTAADYLGRLQRLLGEGEASSRAGSLVGDCYFLNGDYRSAVEAYAAVREDATGDLAEHIFFQRVLAHLRAGDPERARELVDAERAGGELGEEILWKAEWSVLDALRRAGQEGAALERLGSLLGEGPGEVVSAELRVRLRWLRARLELEAGRAEEARLRIDQLLADLGTERFAGLGGELRAAVESQLLLMRGEAYLRMGEPSLAARSFTRLRTGFPESGPAILSFLVESREGSAEGNLVMAQQSLIELVDRFPGSELAPIALWEASLKAEQRGLESSLREAISLLERLVTDYPGSDLVYYARLKQGDLARRLNDFPTALLLYENLLQAFPDHPERYRAELSRADCLLALGSEDAARYDQASILYERNTLLPTVPLEVRIEAGFKWARALKQQEANRSAVEVYYLLRERFIRRAELRETLLLSEVGRYWMARVLLELGELLESSGQWRKAETIYGEHVQLQLPGSSMARERIDELQANEGKAE